MIELKSEITTPTKETEVENPNYTEPVPDELGNLLPSTEPKTIKQKTPVSSTDRAEYLNKQYEKLKKKLRVQIEYGIAKGGLIIKPYVIANKVNDNGVERTDYSIEFDFCQADCFYPLAFNSSGDITEAAFLETIVKKDEVYRRLEYHKWENSKVTIVNKAYKSTNSNISQDMSAVDLGQEVPLSTVPQWADLQETVNIAPVDKPLFAYFKMPEANTIDTTSPLGVSGYSRAVDLIKDADIQYSTLLWEYEGGSLAIDIDRDALNFVEGTGKDGTGGHSVMSNLQRRLYRKVDIGVEGTTYQPYAPSLRDTNYLQGLNAILMRIEDAVALSRGTLSDASAEAKTATELKILKQRSYQANADLQQSIQEAIEGAIYAANVYCTLYQITPEGEYEMSFEWDDSILVDVDTELNKRLILMQNGITSKLENRMWYFGETEDQARQALAKIQEENTLDMETQMAMQFGGLNNMRGE